MPMLINKKAVKAFALNVAQGRAHKFTRVSNEFLLEVNAQVNAMIREKIRSLPSVGKTIK